MDTETLAYLTAGFVASYILSLLLTLIKTIRRYSFSGTCMLAAGRVEQIGYKLRLRAQRWHQAKSGPPGNEDEEDDDGEELPV